MTAREPCPFCGSVETQCSFSAEFDGKSIFRLYCSNCDAFGPMRTSARAATRAWNRRVPWLPKELRPIFNLGVAVFSKKEAP